MGVDQVAPLEPASGLAGLGEGGACPRDRIAQELRVPRICSSSARVVLSGARCLEEHRMRPEGSDPKDSDEGVELDLNDEPGALLDFLNAHERRVAKILFRTLPGLPRHVELSVLDLTLQRTVS